MLIKEVKSLIWLTRWYNGRYQRLEEIHRSHMSSLTCLVLDELGGTPTETVELMLCGFSVRIRPEASGLELLSIAAPELLNGEQLALFSDDELAEAICEFQEYQGGEAA